MRGRARRGNTRYRRGGAAHGRNWGHTVRGSALANKRLAGGSLDTEGLIAEEGTALVGLEDEEGQCTAGYL